jgi:hypothetical protein
MMLGSSPKTSSPTGAANIASFMAAIGFVTVSLRKSIIRIIFNKNNQNAR